MSSSYWKSPSIRISSGSVFTVVVVFFFLLGFWFCFFLLWSHSSKTECSLPQVYWTKSIATKENDSHFCFHNTSQAYSFCSGAHECGGRKRQEEAARPLRQEAGGSGPGSHTLEPCSSESHQASISTLVSSSRWKKCSWTKRFPLLPRQTLSTDAHAVDQEVIHNLHLGVRRQATWRPSSYSSFWSRACLARALSSGKDHSLCLPPSLMWASPVYGNHRNLQIWICSMQCRG